MKIIKCFSYLDSMGVVISWWAERLPTFLNEFVWVCIVIAWDCRGHALGKGITCFSHWGNLNRSIATVKQSTALSILSDWENEFCIGLSLNTDLSHTQAAMCSMCACIHTDSSASALDKNLFNTFRVWTRSSLVLSYTRSTQRASNLAQCAS